MSIDVNLLKKLNQKTLGKDVNTLKREIVGLQDKINSLQGDKFYRTESVLGAKIVKSFVEKFYAFANVDYDVILKDVNKSLVESIENQDTILEFYAIAEKGFVVGRSRRDSLLKAYDMKSFFNFDVYVENLFNSGKINSKTDIKIVNSYYERYFEIRLKEVLSNFKSSQLDINISKKIESDWFAKDDNGDYNRVIELIRKLRILESETKSERFDRLLKLEKEKIKYDLDIENFVSEFKNGLLEYTVNLVSLNEGKLKDLQLTINTLEGEILSKTKEVDSIVSSLNTYDLNKTKLTESVGSDINIIKDRKLVSLMTASEAHTESLKIYGGERINKLILSEASKGRFSVTVSELTDVESLLLLEAGYELTKSTERVNRNNRLVDANVWVINWGNSPNISVGNDGIPAEKDPIVKG